jgi:Xaa-Pro aminopeptidase
VSRDAEAARGLSREGCLRRQAQLRVHLRRCGADAALVSDPRHLMYLFNYYQRSIFPAVGVVFTDGTSVLARTSTGEIRPVFADEVIFYSGIYLGTLDEDLDEHAFAAIADILVSCRCLAVDRMAVPAALAGVRLVDLRAPIAAMRRTKAPDEVALVRRAVASAEAGYAAVAPLIRPGLEEIELFARFQAAAVMSAGEPIGELGNDFRGGSAFGMPRPLPLRDGDLLPLDVGVELRFYYADLCRTFAVNGHGTPLQQSAAERVTEVLSLLESVIRPGVKCRDVHATAVAALEKNANWRFGHHLGHGIGLGVHEAPRINPRWDDVFQEGDVFALEPGVYAEELRAGVRIEENYLLTSEGVERLSGL